MKRLIYQTFLVMLVVAPLRADWPTLHNDYQRSGHTEEVVEGPYERKWWRDFHDEVIATRCEAIVAKGKVFVGTFAGNMYALDVADGKTVWRFTADGPIGASPSYHDGKLYFGSDDSFDSGTLYCTSTETGKLVWKYVTPGGIWTAPACDSSKVYIGDRSGIFHAVRIADGSSAWKFTTGYMILKPASFSKDGKQIILGSEDMHVYCLSPGGKILWKTPKLPGLSLRDQAPTIWEGLAIVRTNPADGFHRVLGRNGEVLEAIQRAIPTTAEDKVLLDKWGDFLMAPRPERRKAEISGILEYLKENRHDQCFFAFDLDKGTEPWVAPILYTNGLHNPPTPPTFNPMTGELYTLSRSALTYYLQGVRRYSCLVRLDRKTGLPEWFWPVRPDEKNWGDFPMIPDESQALSMMGDRVLGTHQGMLAAIDPNTAAVMPISRTRDTYAGIFGPGALPGNFEDDEKYAQQGFLTGMPNEWHGPDRAVLAISDKRMFWVAGSQVVCIAGPDIPTTAGRGKDPPQPFKTRLPNVAPGGNVANRGTGDVDHSLPKREIDPEALAPFLKGPTTQWTHANSDVAVKLRDRLDRAVLTLVRGEDGQSWAPLVIQLGIGQEERYFWRTAETIQNVSLALPHLSPEVRTEAVSYLDRLAEEGCPLKTPKHNAEGLRREPFELGPEMIDFAGGSPHYETGIEELYAIWAYAHYADRWPAIIREAFHIAKIFDHFVNDVPKFDPDDMERDASQRLNARVAGVLAAARIFDRVGDNARRDLATDLLVRLVTERVHHERSDHRVVRPTKGESGGIHQAKIPRYVDLVPELSHMLHQFAGAALDRHITALRKALPLWYQAYGERMIGGENYISPPHLSRGIFLIWADGSPATVKQLAAKLDQPWCHADLYDIEKTSAVLRKLDATE